jgi:hypothetical protein
VRTIAIVLAGLLLHGLTACADTTQPTVPTTLEIVGGDEQEALIAATLAEDLRVRVMDQRGQPVAGVTVTWSGTIGPIAPSVPVTDESGIATASWTLGTIPGSYSIGAHSATAAVAGVGSATFTGYLRSGLEVEDVSFSPSEVDVTSDAAPVFVAVRATNDYGSVSGVAVRFTSPSGGQVIGFSSLAMTSGTAHDGVWEGNVAVPQGAEAGVWTLSGVRIEGLRVDNAGPMTLVANASSLAHRGMPYELIVTAD